MNSTVDQNFSSLLFIVFCLDLVKLFETSDLSLLSLQDVVPQWGCESCGSAQQGSSSCGLRTGRTQCDPHQDGGSSGHRGAQGAALHHG